MSHMQDIPDKKYMPELIVYKSFTFLILWQDKGRSSANGNDEYIKWMRSYNN